MQTDRQEYENLMSSQLRDLAQRLTGLTGQVEALQRQLAMLPELNA